MKRETRQQQIMDLLVADGSVALDALAQRFGVSKMTVHRDLDELERAGLLRKLRGGASIEAGKRFESDFRFRERQNAAGKRRVAGAALTLVEPGMTVIVNDGTTAALLGAMLTERRPLTVITNNCAVIDRLKPEAGITLITLGGEYSQKYHGFFGLVTEECMARLRADLAFISVPAVAGLQAFHMDARVARAKRAMIAAADRSCLLIGHQRFGHTALHLLADLAEFDTIITDRAPGAPAVRALDEAGLSLTVAGPDPGG